MAIAPLQIVRPEEYASGKVDFTPLSEIGKAFADARQQRLLAEAVQSATGPDGKVDANAVGTSLAKLGMTREAMPFVQMGQTAQFHKDTLAHQDAQLAQTGAHYKATESLSRAQLAETQRQHDLLLTKPFLVGSDLSGEIYAVRNRDGGYSRIDPKTFGPAPAQPAPPHPQAAAQPIQATQPQPQKPQISQPVPAQGGVIAPQPTAVPAVAPVDPSAIDPTTGRREGFLKSVPPDAQDIIKKIASYEIDPRSLSIKGGHRERLLGAVAQYDPTYDQNTFPARGKAVRDFATGQQGNAVRSFDVAIDHLDTLQKLATAMGNNDTQVINRLRNVWREQTGSELPTNFNAAKGIVADEISKAIIGSKGALADREETKKPLLAASSPEQLSGAIQTYKELMAGQLKGLKKQYEDTTGRKDFDTRVRENTRATLLGSGTPKSEATAQPVAIPKAANREQANTAIAAAKDAIKSGRWTLQQANETLRQMGVPAISGP